MPSLDLIPHPSTPSGPIRSIGVDIEQVAPAALSLRYRLTGSIDDIALPPIETAARADGLWRHTCFEAFFRQPRSASYVEFNFSPSTRWAAYEFTGYRDGMSDAIESPAPRIGVTRSASGLTLASSLDLAWMKAELSGARLALSAIIEDRSGAKSYWALAHSSAKPDFHHPDGFICILKKDTRP